MNRIKGIEKYAIVLGQPSSGLPVNADLIQSSDSPGGFKKTGPSRLGIQRKDSSSLSSAIRFCKERYKDRKMGICAKAGKQPARGFTFAA